MPPPAADASEIRVDRAPRGIPDEADPVRLPGDEASPGAFAHPVDPGRVRRIAAALRDAADRGLRGRPAAEIAAVLDRVSRRWLHPAEPARRATVADVSARLGWSEASVGWSLDREMETSLGADLLGALDEELSPAAALDAWVEAGDRRRRALGPGLVAGVCSGNVPGLPHLTVMRSLLVKAPVLVKVSRDEPVMLGRYVDTLREEDPGLADCVAVQAWRGGDREVEGALLEEADFLVAYGGREALEDLARRTPPRVRALWHGHRTGACLVAREAVGDPGLARELAEDACAHEQEACLCPAWVFVEGGGAEASRLAEGVDAALAEIGLERPPPRRTTADVAARRAFLDRLLVEEIAGSEAILGARAGPGLSHLVIARRGLPAPPAAPRGRVVDLHAVPRLEEAVAWLGRRPSELQGVALAAGPGGSPALAEALARAGVTRSCPPGRMGVPDMRWRHDGRPCLGDMVRWCEDVR